MPELMIDIETLSTEPNAVVCTVGLAIFDDDKILKSYHFVLDWAKQMEQGRHVDPDTLKWWLSQSSAAQKSLTCEPNNDIVALLTDIQRIGASAVWANSPTFDLVILRDFFASKGLDTPWKFWRERDVRTIKGLYSELDLELPDFKKWISHNAEHDARYQAELVIQFRKQLRKRNP